MRTDVLIVGGGVTGCAAAYHLARRGVEVTLIEQYDLNTQASGRNAGSLHGQIQHEPFLHLGEPWATSFLPALRMLVDSLTIWDTLSDELDTDLEVKKKGGLLIARTDEQRADIARKVAIERQIGLAPEILDASELRALAPWVSPDLAGGELMPVEGKANPLLVAPAFARAAVRHGAVLRTGEHVVTVREDGTGMAVETDRGTHSATTVILAAGGELTRLGADLGLRIPISVEPVQVSVTEPVAPLIEHLVYYAGDKLTLKQARNGSLLIGGGWPARAGADGAWTINPESLRTNLRIALEVAPAIASAQVLRTWVGVGNGTPDQRPILGRYDRYPGLLVGIFPYMGLTAGPIMGLLLADLAMRQPIERDLSPFDPARFT